MNNFEFTPCRMRVKDLGNRWGRFSIDRECIEEWPLDALFMMNGILIVRAESNFVSNAIDYMALSFLFDEVPEGEISPEYVLIFNEKNRSLTVEHFDMPVYEFQCQECGRTRDVHRAIKNRSERVLCDICQTNGVSVIMRRIVSRPNVICDIEPYMDDNMGETPVHVESRQHKARLLKERGLAEIG